jgi:hypothetical protein
MEIARKEAQIDVLAWITTVKEGTIFKCPRCLMPYMNQHGLTYHDTYCSIRSAHDFRINVIRGKLQRVEAVHAMKLPLVVKVLERSTPSKGIVEI